MIGSSDPQLSGPARKLRRRVSEFVRSELGDSRHDSADFERFNHSAWQRLGDFGLLGLPLSRRLGGGGCSMLEVIAALEALGHGCHDNGLLLSVGAHLWGCAQPIQSFGSDSQQRKYIPRLASGEWIGGLAAAEPGAGSDVYALETTADRDDDSFVLNGTKSFVTNGTVADVLVTLAKTESGQVSAFLVDVPAPGLSVVDKLSKMGLRSAEMAVLEFKNCTIPSSNLLGTEGAGTAVFTHAMEWERSCILAPAVGTMQRLLEVCLERARGRQQFGRPIGEFQLVAGKIVDMRVAIETARSLLYRIAYLKEAGKSVLLEASIAKLSISEAWVRTCLNALQLFGGYGYLTDTGLERELRDALGSRLYSGTSELQRVFISRTLGL